MHHRYLATLLCCNWMDIHFCPFDFHPKLFHLGMFNLFFGSILEHTFFKINFRFLLQFDFTKYWVMVCMIGLVMMVIGLCLMLTDSYFLPQAIGGIYAIAFFIVSEFELLDDKTHSQQMHHLMLCCALC